MRVIFCFAKWNDWLAPDAKTTNSAISEEQPAFAIASSALEASDLYVRWIETWEWLSYLDKILVQEFGQAKLPTLVLNQCDLNSSSDLSNEAGYLVLCQQRLEAFSLANKQNF